MNSNPETAGVDGASAAFGLRLCTPTSKFGMKLFRFQTRHPNTNEPIEVEAEYWPPRRGSRGTDGMLLEPDEPREVIIRTVWGLDGVISHRNCEETLVDQALEVLISRRNRVRYAKS